MPRGTKRNKFTAEEDQAIKSGYEKYKDEHNTWAKIIGDQNFGPLLSTRTNTNIKDRWRNIQAAETSRLKALDDLEHSFYPPEADRDHDKAVADLQHTIAETELTIFSNWDKIEIRAIAELMKRHDSSKSVEYLRNKARLECPQKLQKKTDENIESFLSIVRSSPEVCTEDPFPICLRCRKYSQSDGRYGEVELPKNDTGKDYGKFMLICKTCQGTAVVKLQAMFSPRSGCTLARQVSFLRLLFDTQITPYLAAEMVHMDHEPLYKSDPLSKLKTTKSFLAEVLQGRCVPILSEEHTLISRRYTGSSIAGRNEWKDHLKKSRAKLETTLTPERLAALFGDFSLDTFKRSGLFWGVDKHGKRKSFDDCKMALESIWQGHVDFADTGNDEKSLTLRWFIKLGHDRSKIVQNNVDEENLPQDYLEIEGFLKKWSVKQPPFPLVSA